jgi:hypothetical protein
MLLSWEVAEIIGECIWENPLGEQLLGRPRRSCKVNFRLGPTEIGYECRRWMDGISQDHIQQQITVLTVLNRRIIFIIFCIHLVFPLLNHSCLSYIC